MANCVWLSKDDQKVGQSSRGFINLLFLGKQGQFKKVEEYIAYMNDYIEDAENIHNKLS